MEKEKICKCCPNPIRPEHKVFCSLWCKRLWIKREKLKNPPKPK